MEESNPSFGCRVGFSETAFNDLECSVAFSSFYVATS